MGYNSKYYKKTGKKVATKDLSPSQLRSIGRKPSKTSSKSSGGSSAKTSSVPQGLSQAQVDLLRNTPGIDQSALDRYVSSGATKPSGGAPTTVPVVNADTINAGYASALKGKPVSLPGGEPKTDWQNTADQNAIKLASQGYQEGDTLPDGTVVGVNPSPEEWAKMFQEAMGGQDATNIQGTDTQSTQGEQTAVNDQMAPGAVGAVGPGPAGAVGSPITGATGGYVKIGPAYFEKYSDGLRAVSDPTVISGLKHGSIPYSNQGLDGTTFSKYSVPLLDPGKQAMADATLRAMGMTPESDALNQGAGVVDTYNSLQGKYGLNQTQGDFFSDPMSTIKDMVTQIYTMSGVDQANDVIKEIADELEGLENDRDDEIADVNDNPWLTEGVRLRQIESIEGRYEDKIANRTNKLRLLEDVRNNAQQQAQFAIGTAISLWDKERTFQQHQIDMWNEQAQRAFDNDMKLKAYQLDVDNSKYTADAKNWLLAKENGYKGSFYDWLNPPKSSGPGVPFGDLSPYQLERAQRTLESVYDLRTMAEANPGIFGASASLPIPNALRSDAFRDYQAKLATLKSNIAFGELTAMREASKTGGALGQVSDREGRLLESSLGSLEMYQTPEQVVEQLNQIEASITRWLNEAMASGISDPVSYFGGRQGEVVNSPDGPVLIIDDSPMSGLGTANSTTPMR